MSTSPTRSTVDLASSTTSTIAGINFAASGSVKPSLQVAGRLTVGDSKAVDASSVDLLTVTGTLTSFKGQTMSASSLTLNGTLEGPGTMTVSGAATLEDSFLGRSGTSGTGVHLVLEGSSSVPSNTVFFYEGSELENRSTLRLSDGADLDDGDGNTGNELVNDSAATVTFTGSASDQTASVGVNCSNAGTVSVGKGTLSLPALTNLTSGGALSGGRYVANGGSISLANGVSSNAASVTLGASPSAFTVSGSGNALSGLTTNSGTLTVEGSLSLSGSLSTSGTLIVENSSTLSMTSFTQSAGTSTVVGGSTLESGSGSGEVSINGGTLAGTGKIEGDLLGAGDVSSAGTVSGPMTVSGTYNNSAGTLTIQVRGTATAGTDYGQLSASGAATLGGKLTIATKTGYTAPVGTQYTILKAASISGKFASVGGAQLSNEAYAVSYTSTTVVLTVIPRPTVTGIGSPAEGPYKGGNTVTINGTNFASGATVHFGKGASSSVTFVSSTQLTAVAPPRGEALGPTAVADNATPVNVTVTTGGETSEISSDDTYTYEPMPSVVSLSPDTGTTAGGNTVTITGHKFLPGSTVDFGTTPASSVTYLSVKQLTATVPPQSAGSVYVRVTTPGGTTAAVTGSLYAYGPPTLTSFVPTAAITGTKVSIKGTGFAVGMTVMFGSLASPAVTVTSGTTLGAVAPNGATEAPITVSDGQGGATSTTNFRPTLSITSFTPTSGASGTVATINGIGFTKTSSVDFNGVAASSVTFVSSSELKATVPASATTGPITVTNTASPAGTVTSPSSFTVP